KQAVSATLLQALARMRERSRAFYGLLPRREGRFAFTQREEFLEQHGDQYAALMQSLERVFSELELLPKKPEEVFGFARRTRELQTQLAFIMESEDKNTVFWVDQRGEGKRSRGAQTHIILQATPIDVSQILKQTLFENVETAVLTSATLAVAAPEQQSRFEYIRQRLGVEHAREEVLPSHFNYENQAILYVPPDLPDPRSASFARQASEKIRRILDITQGRAFCLFTSYNQMHDMHDRLLGELPYPMLLQGSAPKNALLEEFRS